MKSIFESDEENNQCFDCAATKPRWASVNNGITLCLQCSVQHRDLLDGFSVSKVRSINADFWIERHVRQMKIGGNRNFKAFLQSYDLD